MDKSGSGGIRMAPLDPNTGRADRPQPAFVRGPDLAEIANRGRSRAVRAWLKLAGALCVFEVAYYFAYTYGMSFSQVASSPFWFPDSILLCALLASSPRHWWVLVLALLPIRFFADVAQGIPNWFILATTVNDIAKGLLNAFLLRRFLSDPVRLQTVREFILFFFIAVLLIPSVSALGGAAARSALGSDFVLAWEQWLLGNASAQLVVTPAVLYWVLGARRLVTWRPKRQAFEAVVLAAVLIFTGSMAFRAVGTGTILADSRYFAPVPFMFWAAIRFGMFGASGAVALVTVFAVQAALDGRGMFAGLSPSDTAFVLQQFLLVRAAPLYLVAILIMQMKEAEGHLRDSESRFRNMADTTPVLIWISNADGALTFVNQIWRDFTGSPTRDELGHGWLRHIHDADRGRAISAFETSLDRRERCTAEFRFQRHDGAWRWLMFIGVPRFSEEGEFQGYIGSATDISEQKLAEIERQRHRAELAHITRVATMGEITASISHELKQPLSAILNNTSAAELILASGNPDLNDIRAILADIRADDKRAVAIITRMRSFLQKQDVIREPVDINKLIEDVLALVAVELAERAISVEHDLTATKPWVMGERTHLQQVVLNLVLNAVESLAATPPSVRRLRIQTAVIDDEDVRIAVADNGPGLPDNSESTLFEPFFTTKTQGLGMGLSIARTIVEAHDGRITAETNANGGATFRVTLPMLNEAG
jgi:two-component system, LuxR family, sensor kinase FixL